jgi:hypothetical protein
VAARNGSDKGWERSVLRIVALFVPVAMLVGLPSAAPAQFTWTNNFATNEWNRSDNWSPTTGFPNSTTATATFGNSGLTFGGTVTINPSVQTKSITFNNTTGSYTIGSAAGQTLSAVTDIVVGSGVTTTDTINLANVASGSLLFPSGNNLNISNNAALGANPTLVIGPRREVLRHALTQNGPHVQLHKPSGRDPTETLDLGARAQTPARIGPRAGTGVPFQ